MRRRGLDNGGQDKNMRNTKISDIVKIIDINALKPYPNNPRKNEHAVEPVANSIREFGFKQPIVVDKNNTIIAGHTRLLAARELGLTEVPVIVADDLTPEQVKAYRLADNKTGELAGWDFEQLDIELGDIADIDMSRFGFDEDANEKEDIDGWADMEYSQGSLVEEYIEPPFSVLNASSKRWQERKNIWKEKGLFIVEGRKENLLGGTRAKMGEALGMKAPFGTSLFDPVLCEVMYKWFGIDNGIVFDPFAGGPVRGCVAAILGMQYVGIDLSGSQVEANKEKAAKLGVSPVWYCDDSINLDKYIEDESADMILTCPPYVDIEKYSNDPRDISNMEYKDFIEKYRDILTKAVKKLKNNRFAVIVVGEVRNDRGFYHHFVSDTERIVSNAGAGFYNEIILVDCICSLIFTAGKAFSSSRKIGKRHQNVLCFFKGDPKTIKDTYKKIECPDEILDAATT